MKYFFTEQMNERTSVFPSVKRFLSHQCPSRCMKECSLLCRAPCRAQNKHVIYNSHHPHPARVRAISPAPICGPCSLLNPSISPFLSLSFSPSYVLNTLDHFLCLVHTLHPQSSAQHPFPSHIPPPPSHRELPGVLRSFIWLSPWATLSLVLVSWSPRTTHPGLLPHPQSQE